MSEPVPLTETNNPEPKSDTLPRDSNEVDSADTPVREKDLPASIDLNALHQLSAEELAALALRLANTFSPAGHEQPLAEVVDGWFEQNGIPVRLQPI